MDIVKGIAEFTEKSKETIKNIDFDPDKKLEQMKGSFVEKIRDVFNPDNRVLNIERSDKKYLSTLEERISFAANTDCIWTGKVGESKCIPNNVEIQKALSEFGVDGIKYRNGIPDFSPISIEKVKISEMSETRWSNFAQADKKCANLWNKEAKDGKRDWNQTQVRDWRKENGYSWHEHNDRETCYLAKTDIHLEFKHLGGVSECKKEANMVGGNFDE